MSPMIDVALVRIITIMARSLTSEVKSRRAFTAILFLTSKIEVKSLADEVKSIGVKVQRDF